MNPAKTGDTVYVWRDTADFRGWTGPRVVVAESSNGRSLWVSLRGYLIKSAREQVRQATTEEHLGAELIKVISQEMLESLESGKMKNFRDIEGEGLPPENVSVSAEELSRIEEGYMEDYEPSLPPDPTESQSREVEPGNANPMEVDLGGSHRGISSVVEPSTKDHLNIQASRHSHRNLHRGA